MRNKFAVCVRDRGRRRVDDGLRQDPLGQVIHALEASPRMRGDLPGPEQPLERNLAFAPAPPAALAAVARADLGHAERAAIANFREHLAAEGGTVAPEPRDVAPGAVAVLRALHAPAQQWLALDRHQRRLVTPVLEQLSPAAAIGGCVQQRHGVRAEPGEQRQVVRPDEHVDRVDLQQAERAHGADYVGLDDVPTGALAAKPLRRERDPPRLGQRQRFARPAEVAHARNDTGALPLAPRHPSRSGRMIRYSADVIVIGAGIAGVTAAIELLNRGRRVLLLDRDAEENMGGLAKESFGGIWFAGTPLQRATASATAPSRACVTGTRSPSSDRTTTGRAPGPRPTSIAPTKRSTTGSAASACSSCRCRCGWSAACIRRATRCRAGTSSGAPGTNCRWC